VVKVSIRYNGHKAGDWMEVFVGEHAVYKGHGLIGPTNLYDILAGTIGYGVYDQYDGDDEDKSVALEYDSHFDFE
jgi:hypothetical protein